MNIAFDTHPPALLVFYVIVRKLLSKAGENASCMRSFLTELPIQEFTKYRMLRDSVITIHILYTVSYIMYKISMVITSMIDMLKRTRSSRI